MVFLDLTAEEFFDKFPFVKKTIVEKCNSLNLPINNIQPYITKDYIGAVLNPGQPNRIKYFTPRDEEISHIKGMLIEDILDLN